jgi:hypothetical protein
MTVNTMKAAPISDFVQGICSSRSVRGKSCRRGWFRSRGSATRTLPFSVGGPQ